MSIPSSVASLLFVAGGAVAALGLWLLVRQHALVFRPSRVLVATPGDLGLRYEDVALQLTDGGTVRGWWIPGPSGSPAVLHLPGTVGNMAFEVQTVSLLASLGVSILIVDYPGFGGSDGKPSESGCYEAGRAAWDFLRNERKLTEQKIVLSGRSLGCAVASCLASRFACRGLILHSSYTSLVDLASRLYPFFPVRPFCFIKINSLQWVRQCYVPVLFLHPEEDELIPLTNVRRLYDEAPAPKRFLLLRGGHFGDGWRATDGLRMALADVISGRAAAWSRDGSIAALDDGQPPGAVAALRRRSRRWWKTLVWSTIGRTK